MSAELEDVSLKRERGARLEISFLQQRGKNRFPRPPWREFSLLQNEHGTDKMRYRCL